MSRPRTGQNTEDDNLYISETNSSQGNRTRHKILIKIKAEWSVFEKYGEISLSMHLPINLKRKVFNQCVLPTITHWCQTWSPTEALAKKLETGQ